jgi:uncharacterized protein YjeT (DUF2065 family)
VPELGRTLEVVGLIVVLSGLIVIVRNRRREVTESGKLLGLSLELAGVCVMAVGEVIHYLG